MRCTADCLVTLAAFVSCTAAAGEPVRGVASYYEFVEADVDWHEARALASARTHLGRPGYLATIRTGRENSFVLANFFQERPGWMAWFGGYEPVENEVWLWADGPEAGAQMSQGEHPVPPYFYANWGGAEPTDSGGVGHDYAAINLGQPFAGIGAGEWTAVAAAPSAANPVRGLLVEYPLGVDVPAPSGAACSVGVALALAVRRARRARRPR